MATLRCHFDTAALALLLFQGSLASWANLLGKSSQAERLLKDLRLIWTSPSLMIAGKKDLYTDVNLVLVFSACCWFVVCVAWVEDYPIHRSATPTRATGHPSCFTAFSSGLVRRSLSCFFAKAKCLQLCLSLGYPGSLTGPYKTVELLSVG